MDYFTTTTQLTIEDRELYTEHLRIVNKIVCSYSRYEAFVAALGEIGAAKNYTVIADIHVKHDLVFIFDEEGFMNTFHLTDDVVNDVELT